MNQSFTLLFYPQKPKDYKERWIKKINNQLIKLLPTFIGIQIQPIKLQTTIVFFQTKILQIKNIISGI